DPTLIGRFRTALGEAGLGEILVLSLQFFYDSC
ncbi:MAG: hypothetical protein K0R08_340, partial [Solimicrobium sp.]|nr:hypothetical protein [Solimicrobium sp.]